MSLLIIEGFGASSVTAGPPAHNSDFSFLISRMALFVNGILTTSNLGSSATCGSLSLTTISITDFFLPKKGFTAFTLKEFANSRMSSSTDSMDKILLADPASRFKSLKLFLEEASIDPRGT
ncbi:MAG: hypothetical protein DDT40_01873 [candidate division WS2 bacterium]|nr:hypothetical protein [Candidatus Psychracetigena formicireducens]